MIEIVPNWHPLWVHFPIALLTVAVLLFWLGRFWPEVARARTLITVARWNLGLGVLFLVPTLITGYLAYNSVAHDSAGHEAMERHLVAAWIASGLFVVAAVLAWRERQQKRTVGMPLLAVLLAGLVAIGVTGYLGAENVYRHGIGVERLPNPDDHHHGHGDSDHEHDASESDGHEHSHDHDH